MYDLKKIGKVLTSKSVGTGPSFYEKRIYRAAVSQRLRYTALWDDTRRRLLSGHRRFRTVQQSHLLASNSREKSVTDYSL
jgi:hypothetical protein